MIGLPITASTVAKWTGARCIGCHDLMLHNVSIDSRVTKNASLFVALPGGRTDGHVHLMEALAPRKSAVLIRRKYYQAHRHKLREFLGHESHVRSDNINKNTAVTKARELERALLVVRDPLHALLRLARCYLKRIASPCRIAITGSSGKTTTKELLASMVGGVRDLFYSAKNQNSAIGVPLSVLSMKRKYQYMINEVGTGWRGEIPAITDVLNPHIVVITNIGHAHIAAFGSRMAIAREKFALAYQSNALRTLYIRQADEQFARRIVRFHPSLAKKIRFYDKDAFTRQLSYVSDKNGGSVTIGDRTIRTELRGDFQRENLFAAAVVAHHLNLSIADISAGLVAYRPLFGRMQRVDVGAVTLLVDCYNASPESVIGALAYLQQFPAIGQKICILGTMHELGAMSSDFHRKIFAQALASDFDHIICIGDEFSVVNIDQHARACHFLNLDDAYRKLTVLVKDGDVLLFKGSRKVGLESLAEKIQQQVGIL